jgi:molybdopterin/thiamine biosynthesis adenylyltransferase
MRIEDPAALVITAEVAMRIEAYGSSWGTLSLAINAPDGIIGAVGVSDQDGTNFMVSRTTLKGHVLASVDSGTKNGLWYRVSRGLHDAHEWMLRVGARLPTSTFAEQLPAWRQAFKDSATVVLTYSPEPEVSWAAWAVTNEFTVPLLSTVLREAATDPTAGLAPAWPKDRLSNESATVIGIGSIGSAVVHSLAMSGIGVINLVDDDRLLWGNLVRHQSTRRDIGRYKVDSVADTLRANWPGTKIQPYRLNVISDADLMRPLFKNSSVVVCATDGVAPRRVVSHLARRAHCTAILACVLLDGAIGEILRLRPWPGYGCLLCQRARLVSDGSLDPEPALDRPYGTGDRHQPMTAVGSDLALVGQLAAKLAIATILESKGVYDQRLRKEYAIIGLRPDEATRAVGAPFNVDFAEVRWLPHVAERIDCPTCVV